MTTVNIIVCTRNRCRSLDETLSAIDRLEVPGGLSVEVVVVDNGSTDETPGRVERRHLRMAALRLLRVPVGGKAAALNAALASTAGDLVLLLDDDVRPREDWLRRITEPLLERRLDAVAGAVVIPAHLQRCWMERPHRVWLASSEGLDPTAPDSAIGANMGFARRVLAGVPQFDPRLGPGGLGLWEDTLFSMQLKAAGYSLGLAADAVVEHHFDPERLTRASFLARARSEARSSAYVAWHWRHEDRRWPRTRIAYYTVRLALKRSLSAAERPMSEGVARWEMDLVTGIEFERAYMDERTKPTRYERFGAARTGQRADPNARVHSRTL